MEFLEAADGAEDEVVVAVDDLALLLLREFDAQLLEFFGEEVPVGHAVDGRVPLQQLYFVAAVHGSQQTAHCASALQVHAAELPHHAHRPQPLPQLLLASAHPLISYKLMTPHPTPTASPKHLRGSETDGEGEVAGMATVVVDGFAHQSAFAGSESFLFDLLGGRFDFAGEAFHCFDLGELLPPQFVRSALHLLDAGREAADSSI